MIPEQEIKDWWERKVANYLQNYARRNRLTIAQAKEIFFIETHEKFVESVPQLLKKLLDEKYRRDLLRPGNLQATTVRDSPQ